MSRLSRVWLGGLLLLLLSLACARPAPQLAPTVVYPIQPLHFTSEPFCTAFSINESAGYWVTARHCAQHGLVVHMLEGGPPMLVAGVPATVIFMDQAFDVAVLVSAAQAPGLKRGSLVPMAGDAVAVEGYPYGLPFLVRTTGSIAARRIPLERLPADILDVTVAGGNSGSPVLTWRGAVIGVVWGRFLDAPHAIAVPYEQLEVLRPYWDPASW